MSDTIIINYTTDEGLTININDNDDVIVNVIDEPDIIVNLCDDLDTTANNYDYLDNKPIINNVELVGNKTLDDLGIEPKRGINDFYITNAEKTQGKLATGNAVLSTVKQVADRTDRLLVDFNVPTNTTSITFDRDKNGILFSDLGIKNYLIKYYINSVEEYSSFLTFTVNSINTNTYKQNGNLTSGIFSRFGSESWGICELNIIKNLLFYETRSGNSIHDYDDNTSTNDTLFIGINRTIQNINSININVGANIIKAGSNIKIYRND